MYDIDGNGAIDEEELTAGLSAAGQYAKYYVRVNTAMYPIWIPSDHFLIRAV